MRKERPQKQLFQIVMLSMLTILITASISGATMYCYSCHGSGTDIRPLDTPYGGSASYRNISTGAVLGNHQKHLQPGSGPANCAVCHYDNVNGKSPVTYATNHRSGQINFQANINSSPSTALYSKAATAPYFTNQTSVPTAGTCSNVNCHFQKTTLSWGSTPYSFTSASVNDCDQCHGNGSIPAPQDGSHPGFASNKHGMYYGTDTTSCVKCHTDHTAEANKFEHATSAGNRSLVMQGTEMTSANYSLSANLNYPNYLTNAAASRNGTCSNIYCHSNGQTTTAPFTANTPPKWGDNGLVTCASCHGGAVGSTSVIASGKHTQHINNAALIGTNFGCVDCHAKTVTNDSTIGTNANHVNKLKDYSGARGGKAYSAGNCSATYCHTNGKGTQVSMAATLWTGAATMGCNGCHGTSNASGAPDYTSGIAGSATANSHTKHTVAGATTCVSCHSTTVNTAGTAIVAGGIHLNNNIDVSLIGYTPATKTCSTSTCHTGGGIVTAVPAQWGATLSCTGCHGDGTTGTLSAKHTAHVNNAAVIGTNFGCVECHAKTVSNNTTVSTPANHMNSFVDFSGAKAGKSSTYVTATGVCSATYCHSDGKGTQLSMATNNWKTGPALGCNACHGTSNAYGAPDYTSGTAGSATANSHAKHTTTGATSCVNCHGTTVNAAGTAIVAGGIHLNKAIDVVQGGTATLSYTAATKTCSTSTCHTGGGIIASVGSAQWGATLTCSGCHGDGTTGTLSAKHAAHVNNAAVIGTNFGCVECHAKTVSNNTTVSTPANHLNSFVDFSGAKAGKSSTYVTATGVCSATYCHSNGKGTQLSMATNNWKTGPALGCNACHGTSNAYGAPDYTSGTAGSATANSHAKHVTNATSCVNCHGTTVNAAGTAIIAGGIHLNKAIDVVQGGTATLSYTAATKTCSTSSCHTGGGIVAAASAQWGATLTCTGCHGDGTTGTLSAKHAAHVNNAAVIGTNFGCVDCHAATVSSNTVIGTPANHMNNAVNLSGTKWTASPYTGGNCSATYCHSNGKGTQVSMASSLWTGAATLGCNGCHGTSNAFGAPDYASGTAGSATANNHIKHVTSLYGGNNVGGTNFILPGSSSCVYCHSGTVNTAGTAITGAGNHINQNIDVVQGGTHTLSYTSATKTCSTSTCHTGGGLVPGASVQWGATLDCAGCHGYPPANTNHTGVQAGTCNSCHSEVAAGGTQAASSFVTPALHMNGKVDGGNCDACHGYPPVKSVAGIGIHNNYTGAKLSNYSGGGGVHNIAGHLALTIKPTDSFSPCLTCHPQGITHNQGNGTFLTANVQVVVDPKYKFDKNRPIVYNAKQSGTGKTSGTCANVECHFQKSPIWSTETYTQGH